MLEKRELGKSGLYSNRIGISSSFGADSSVYEEAFDRGCTYFTWGTFIKGRNREFQKFVRQKGQRGQREQLVIGLLSYSHTTFLGDHFLRSALRQLGTEYIDCLLLGYFSQRPSQRLLDWAAGLKDKQIIKAVGLTTHNRKVVANLLDDQFIDYFHFRYNAVHRGAEEDIFPQAKAKQTGLVSFTATSWRQLINEKKMPQGVAPLASGDCYRFVLSRNEIDCCMMGVKNTSQLSENFRQIDMGPLDEEELEHIRRIGDHIYGRK